MPKDKESWHHPENEQQVVFVSPILVLFGRLQTKSAVAETLYTVTASHHRTIR
jgi:hypothetical protein